MKTAAITSKGQITIPADIREALGLDVGDRIKFEEIAPGRFSFEPVQKNSVHVLKGLFPRGQKTVSIEDMKAAISRRGAAAK